MSILDDIGSIFTGPVDAIQDAVSFFQWIGWLFNPVNWLRMVEFVVGAIMFAIGLNMAVKQRTGVNVGGSVKRFTKDVGELAIAKKVLK